MAKFDIIVIIGVVRKFEFDAALAAGSTLNIHMQLKHYHTIKIQESGTLSLFLKHRPKYWISVKKSYHMYF